MKFPSGTTAKDIINWRGLTFIKTHSTNATWTPATDQNFKFGGVYLLDSDVASKNGSNAQLTITSAAEVDLEVDSYLTINDASGNVYSLLRPVGGTPCR